MAGDAAHLMDVVLAAVAGFIGSVFVSSGYYRHNHGEGVPPRGWFRFANEMVRRERYSNTERPASELLPPKLSVAAGLVSIAAAIFLVVNAALH